MKSGLDWRTRLLLYDSLCDWHAILAKLLKIMCRYWPTECWAHASYLALTGPTLTFTVAFLKPSLVGSDRDQAEWSLSCIPDILLLPVLQTASGSDAVYHNYVCVCESFSLSCQVSSYCHTFNSLYVHFCCYIFRMAFSGQVCVDVSGIHLR